MIGPDQTLPDFALKVAKAARAFDPSSPPPGSGNNAQVWLCVVVCDEKEKKETPMYVLSACVALSSPRLLMF